MAGYVDRGLAAVQVAQEEIRKQAKDIGHIEAKLNPAQGSSADRQSQFAKLQEEFQGSSEPMRQHFAKVMENWAPGLFVGGDKLGLPMDNLDLERWFRRPKGHERRIHGHKHAGIRIVQEGPTLVLALDAHARQTGPFTVTDLMPYRKAVPPSHQQEAIHRRKVMRKARSIKKRKLLLAELERRYLDES